MATRRERLRREMLREIGASALRHLRDHGAAGLSLRAVARDVGMSPAGLYRYVDGRDDLLTQLIVSGYDDLADHLLAAVGAPAAAFASPDDPPAPPDWAVAADAPAGARLRALCLAYRAWAVAHPNHFALLYGDPVPGYDAPADGVTTRANTRVGSTLAQPLVAEALAGRLRLLPHADDPDVAARLGPLADQFPPGAPAGLGGTVLLAWARVHGLVALELNGQFAFLFGDDARPLLVAAVDGLLDELGLADAPA